jgi:hypothetical protein
MSTEEKWVLRWFKSSGEGFGYYRPEHLYGLDDDTPQKDAERFPSKAAAKATSFPFTHFGFGGPDDTCGWKPMRLVRYLKAGDIITWGSQLRGHEVTRIHEHGVIACDGRDGEVSWYVDASKLKIFYASRRGGLDTTDVLGPARVRP